MEIKYSTIKEIVKNVEIQGAIVKVQFQASNQTTPMEGVGTMTNENKDILKSTAKTAAKSAATTGIISFFARLLGRSIGGAGGAVVGQAARSTGNAVAQSKSSADMQKSVTDVKVTDEKKEVAIVQAFSSLSDFYEWSEDKKCWLVK